MANVFDQFDESLEPVTTSSVENVPAPTPSNVFDQFDEAEERGILDTLGGAAEIAATIGSSVVGDIAGGIAGLGTGIATQDSGAGTAVLEGVQDALKYEPRGEAGKEMLKDIGEIELLQNIASITRKTEQTLADMGYETESGPLRTALAVALPTAIGEFMGASLIGGAVKQTGKLAKGAAKAVEAGAGSQLAKDLFKYQTPTKQKIAKMLEQGSTDVETAKFKLVDEPEVNKAVVPEQTEPTSKIQSFLNSGGPRVTKDVNAVETIKQGFDEGVIAAIKGANPVDKKKMLEMVNVMEKGKKNKRFAALNRPSDIAGESLLNRFKIVRDANKKAGKELDKVANSLKGKRANPEPAINSFIDDLDSMGITLGNDLKPKFKGSDIEGVVPAERVITQIVNRMKLTKTPDAYDMHRLKKFIDEQVTFGKTAEGLAGRTELVLKKLRRNIDGILDSEFPEYNRVNTTFSETIGAIDALQDVAGKKMNLIGPNADKATGTLLRRLMSNAQSRVRLLDSIEEIETVANKYSGTGKELAIPGQGRAPKAAKIEDDLLTQVLFADELDRVFGPVARTSFQGQIDQAIKQGVKAGTSRAGAAEAALDAVGKAAEKLRGIDEEGAFNSIKKLLKSSK